MADTEFRELSKSNREVPLRTGAGLEVRGKPVRQWNTIDAAESNDLRNFAFSEAVGTHFYKLHYKKFKVNCYLTLHYEYSLKI